MLKAALVGLLGAVFLAIAWLYAALRIPIWWQIRQQGGSGIGASYVNSGSVLLAALVGFGAGFLLTMRRVS
jgi:hypothetical protein